MGDRQEGGSWGTILVLLTVGALAFWWYDGREAEAPPPPPPPGAARPADPLVHRSAGWAPPARAVLKPGIQTLTQGGGQCTTNFVFTDARGAVYLGQAAHCAGTDDLIDGCRAKSRPLGTVVSFQRGGTVVQLGQEVGTGRLAYSSWLTMQRRKEGSRAACVFNDFALVRVDGKARSLVNPSMPHWGGPTGLSQGTMYGTERVFGIGRSGLRRPESPAARQSGITMPDEPRHGGWSHRFVARSPGIPGDSGSGYLDVEGRALGTLSTLAFGAVLVNAVGDLRQELAYARRHSGIRGLRLELGTVPFDRAAAASAR